MGASVRSVSTFRASAFVLAALGCAAVFGAVSRPSAAPWLGGAEPTPPPNAFVDAEPVATNAREVVLKVRSGETLGRTLARAGLATADVARIDAARAPAVRPGLTVRARLADTLDAASDGATLLSAEYAPSAAAVVRIARDADGDLAVANDEAAVERTIKAATGRVEESLYASIAEETGGRIADRALAALSTSVDFGRGLDADDAFRVAYSQSTTEDGRPVGRGELVYVSLQHDKGATTLYRYARRGGRAEWFDAHGRNLNGVLLRTPLNGARVTSRYGPRRHPISGYHRQHQGVDFGAPSGTPVYAAGEGVVVEAKRWGGYGKWLRIRHDQGWETGYAHLSGYARGLGVGDRVSQGQVVAYVGSTGASTGPHLHYETWFNGRRRDPSDVRARQLTTLAGSDLRGFRAQKAAVERALVVAERASPEQLARGAAADCAGPCGS